MTVFIGCSPLFTLALLLLALAGCVQRLPEGRVCRFRAQRLCAGQQRPAVPSYHHPAGKSFQACFLGLGGPLFALKDGTLKPDMETELWKKWNFYYSFFFEKNSIRVIDKREGRAVITLFLESPAHR
jgi:hypothetical protein